MKKLILLTCLTSSVFATDIIGQESGFWSSSEVVTGEVKSFSKAPGFVNVAVLNIDSIKIPEQYKSNVSNCRAYLAEDSSTWTFWSIVCDYQKDNEVLIRYPANIDLPPLNTGDRIKILLDKEKAQTTRVPILGYLRAFVYPRGSFESDILINKIN